MELEFLLKLQEMSNKYLDMLFIGITNIGHELTYMVIIMILYWCVSKKVGLKLIIALTFSQLLNTDLKNYFKVERPYLNPQINAVYMESAPGYSFPSGHSQNSAAFWFYCSYMLKNKALKIITLILPFLIAFSRLYLRVHWPSDVLAALFIGLITMCIVEKVMSFYTEKKLDIAHIIFYSIAIPTILLILSGFDADAIKISGAFAGILIGYFIENKYINFEEHTNIFFQILKLLIGVAFAIAIKEGLKIILPDILIFSYVRYFLLGIWLTLFAPWLFVKLKLNSKKMF